LILVGLSILATIGLLALIVWALHRNQQRENEENVDRNLPLPPLQLNDHDVGEIPVAEEILGIAPVTSQKTEQAPIARKDTKLTVPETADTWLSSSREALPRGDFESALQACSSALPQMGAFRQSCVVLRAQIRELKKQGKSDSRALEQLYQFAAHADFFHGKVADTKTLPTSAIKQVNYLV